MPSTTTPGNPGPRTRASTAGKTRNGKKTADPRETRSAVQAAGNREEPHEPEEPASPSLRLRPRGPVQIATAPPTTSSRKARTKRPEVTSQPADEEDDFEQTFGRPKNLFTSASAPVLTGSAKVQERSSDDLSEYRYEPADEYDHSKEKDSSGAKDEDASESAVNRTITALLKSYKSINSKKEPQRKPATPSKSTKSTKSTTGEQEPLYNYVYETVMTEDGPVLYKFGMSGDPLKRRKDIKRTCKYVKLREVRSTIEEHPSMSARMTEALIHAELRSFKHDQECDCEAKHREYFYVSKDVALQAHKRWVTFCRKEPWGRDGKLLPFWEDRLQKKQKLDKNCGYEGLAASWEEFTRPSEFDRQLWDAQDRLRQRTWWLKLISSIAFAQAAIIAFLVEVQWLSALLVSLWCLSGCYFVWKWEGGPEPDAVQSGSAPQESQPIAKQGARRRAAKTLPEKTTDDSPARPGDKITAPIVIGDDQEEVAELAADEDSDEPTDTPALDPEDEECADDLGIALLDEADNPEKWSGDEMDWLKDDEVNRSTDDEMDLSKATEILGLEQRLGSVNLGDRFGFEREGFGAGGVRVGGTSVPVAA